MFSRTSEERAIPCLISLEPTLASSNPSQLYYEKEHAESNAFNYVE